MKAEGGGGPGGLRGFNTGCVMTVSDETVVTATAEEEWLGLVEGNSGTTRLLWFASLSNTSRAGRNSGIEGSSASFVNPGGKGRTNWDELSNGSSESVVTLVSLKASLQLQ